MNDSSEGSMMHQFCHELFPICRSITGNGFRQSLNMLKELVPELEIHEVASGTQCFDWAVPKEWNIADAYILDPEGNKICDFKQSNLHVMGYSIPVNKSVTLNELQEHLYSLPDQPDAIPYMTSYYKERWGFCITHQQRETLKQGNYQVVIDSVLENGNLTYGEIYIPGEIQDEIFFSSYLCHPSMANNELSGPVVTTFLAKWVSQLKNRKHSFRFVIIPETIGSIVYLSRNIENLKKRVVAGFNLTCVGDDRTYSFLPSRQENTLSDQVARHVLKHVYPEYTEYDFLTRGSDERQYCSPGVDLPVCSIMRSKYDCYPEYHTSLDDLTVVTPSGLQGSYDAYCRAIECIEKNETLQVSVLCEPQLGKRGLYPTLSTKDTYSQVMHMMNFITYCDGTMSALEICNRINAPFWELFETIDKLKKEGLLITA
ncbi:DUF4910 domain-containing protein [Pelagibaculum spongiae]|uniref:Aminopeptidase n=1 Tax=Pelagibaculum spongiae TaxID=2080658 RepID=A0A2V1GY00_9GAMM|nr:DUF4910 domain-containing protein [Pelagibaculum spongiae]PVZ70207.1 aminopeptidase [Pelagibaculum spongiae]